MKHPADCSMASSVMMKAETTTAWGLPKAEAMRPLCGYHTPPQYGAFEGCSRWMKTESS